MAIALGKHNKATALRKNLLLSDAFLEREIKLADVLAVLEMILIVNTIDYLHQWAKCWPEAP